MKHPSPYLKIYPASDPETRLLFSTLKGSIALVPQALAQALEDGTVPDEAAELLGSLGMAVDDPEAERARALDYLDEINRLDKAVQVSVILTMECNFACPYCYEGRMKGASRMTPEIADALVQFLKNLMTPDKKELHLHYYGGEPLLGVDLIKRISGPLKAFAAEKNIIHAFTLVTNGSLLTPETVSELKSLGLQAAKTTLDGPPEEHDRTRPLRHGGPTFDKIIKNLKSCPEGVKLAVGGNYTEGNYQKFPALLDLLLANGLGPGRIAEIQFNPVLKTIGAHANPEYGGGCGSMDEPWLIPAAVELRAAAAARGYRVPRIVPSPCMVDVASAFTVHVDGSITQCASMIGRAEFATGSVFAGLADHRAQYRLGHYKESAACRDCGYLPLCFGGCRYMAHQRDGEFTLDCKKAFYDGALGPMLL